MYRETIRDLPPLACEGCEMNHALIPENFLAWRVVEACLSQLRHAPNGVVVGIDNRAVWEQIDREASTIEAPYDTFRKVKAAEAAIVEFSHEQHERERKKAEQARKAQQS